MLSSHEAALVVRDSAIPGLRSILDSDIFLATMQAKFPHLPLQEAERRYIRYKPGTSCLVAYRLKFADKLLDLYAKAHGNADANIKIAKALSARLPEAGPAVGRIALEAIGTVVSAFPNDSKLQRLRRLADPEVQTGLFHKFLGESIDLQETRLVPICYKPERRYVASIDVAGVPRAAVKFYTSNDFPVVYQNATAFSSDGILRIPRFLGKSRRLSALAFEWLPGSLLTGLLSDPQLAPKAVQEVGSALRIFHSGNAPGLRIIKCQSKLKSLLERAEWLGFVLPELTGVARNAAQKLAGWLENQPEVLRPSHGDFYAKQILWSSGSAGIVDFDEAHLGNPVNDLALFIAHLERDQLRDRLTLSQTGTLKHALIAGYEAAGGEVGEYDVLMRTAVELLQLAHGPFRACEADWEFVTAEMLQRVCLLIQRAAKIKPGPTALSPIGPRAGEALVEDALQAIQDPKMPFLKQATDPKRVTAALQRLYNSERVPPPDKIDLQQIRVIRHKAGRRCLVEYRYDKIFADGRREAMQVLGKARAKGFDQRTYRLMMHLQTAGFDAKSPDNISVPAVVGALPEFQMWLQQWVPGIPATKLIFKDQTILPRKIAAAIAKVHRLGLVPKQVHTIAEELEVLHQRLGQLAISKPALKGVLKDILRSCDRIGGHLELPAQFCGIHRDFYPDQVLVDGNRLYLLDFDLYCHGEPGLDIGNFQGHLSEYSFRYYGHSDALSIAEDVLEKEYLELAGEKARGSIHLYRLLTLVRHIYISTLFPERQATTGPLIEYCRKELRDMERRLA